MKILYGFLFTVISIAGFSQTLRGKVTDSNGTALAGATIQLNGQGTITEQDGAFSIACGNGATLVVSYVGYETMQQAIADCSIEVSIKLMASTQVLNEVEITATSNQNKLLLSQPASIAKVGNIEIKRGLGLFLDDAINTNIPGVYMQRRTVSAGQQFNIRGYGNGLRGTNGASSNFDTQGTKVYLNGIAITDAEGITLLDDIDFGSIGNVEILKGPSGSLYGLAIAGVVNLKTITPEKGKSSIGQEAMFGSYGLRRLTTRLQIGGEKSSVLLSYGRQDYDGFMKHTASQKDFVNMVGEFHPNAKQSITTYFGYANSYDQRNGELTVNQYNSLDYSGNPRYLANDAHSNIISFRAGVGHLYKINSNISNNTTLFGSGISSNVSSAGGWTDKLPMNIGVRSTFDFDFSLPNKLHLSGIAGIESQQQTAQTIGYAMTDPVSGQNNNATNYINTGVYNYIGAQQSNVYAVSKTSSIFTEWTLAFPHDLSITAGIGMSNMDILLNNRQVTSTNTTPTNRPISAIYDNLISPRVAINKIFSKQASAYVSYSKGYKAPVSSYFYIPFTGQLNSGLRPEVGNQFEIGSKGSVLHDKLFYQVALFYTKFTDKMTVVAVPDANNGATAYTYVANGGEQDHKGIEVLVKYNALQSSGGFFKTVAPFVNLAYSDFTYGNFKFQQLNGARTSNVETDYTGKKVAGVPTITYNVGVDAVTNSGFYGNVNYNYRGEVYFVSTNEITSPDLINNPNNEAQAKDFALLNAKIGFRKTLATHFDVDVYLGVQNITNQQHYQMLFVNQLPDSYLPGPKDANYFGGLNFRYIF